MFKVGDKIIGLCQPGDPYSVTHKNAGIMLITKLDRPDYMWVKLEDDEHHYVHIKYFKLIEDELAPTPEKTTGERLNSGKLRWRNFPLFLVEPLAEVGAKAEKHESNPAGKYETFNFLKGMKVNDTLDSLKRHLMKFESPYEPDTDEESQCSHLAHIAWNALVALHNIKTRPDLDDRFKLPTTELSEQEKLETAEEIQKRGR